MPTFSEMKTGADSPTLVRRILEAVAFMAPGDTAFPASITGVGGALTALPAQWWPVGLVTKDGYTFGSDVTKEEVEALGYSSAIRSDITKAPKMISFTALESDRRPLAELMYGMDLSAVVPDINGAISFDEPDLPSGEEFRFLVIGRDGTAAAPYYRGRGYGRVKISKVPEEVWGASDPRQYPIELDVLVDELLGTPVRHYIGGNGVNATALGYAA